MEAEKNRRMRRALRRRDFNALAWYRFAASERQERLQKREAGRQYRLGLLRIHRMEHGQRSPVGAALYDLA